MTLRSYGTSLTVSASGLCETASALSGTGFIFKTLNERHRSQKIAPR